MDIFALFRQMLILLFILLIGFVAAKKKVLNDKTNAMLSTLICTLTNPAQVIASALSQDHPLENGEVCVSGRINSIEYFDDAPRKKRFSVFGSR